MEKSQQQKPIVFIIFRFTGKYHLKHHYPGKIVIFFLFLIFFAAETGTAFSAKDGKVFASPASGAYPDQSISLVLTCPDGYDIFYTTDGSIPDKSSARYIGPILLQSATGTPDFLVSPENTEKILVIDWPPLRSNPILPKANIIRAVAVDSSGRFGPVMTASYWLGMDLVAEYPGAAVVSLVADPHDLLDYDKGIMVKGAAYDRWATPEKLKETEQNGMWWFAETNSTQRGRDWERPASITLLDGKNTASFEEICGIRIRGGATRINPQKSFSIYFRKEYGNKTLTYPLFPDSRNIQNDVLGSYKSFSLRNGGNEANYLEFKDGMIMHLLKELDFSIQEARPAILFLNGEFWGVYNLQEKYSADFIEEHYGVDKENVIIIEEGAIDEGTDADIIYYDEFTSFAEKDLRIAENWDAFSSAIDIQSMADYFAAEIYFGNADWSENKNFRMWRSRYPGRINDYDDGRWRFMLYDTEYSLCLYWQEKTLWQHDHFADALHNFPIFASALRNPEFRSLFLESITRIGTEILTPEKVSAAMETNRAIWQPLMAQNYLRYGDTSKESKKYADGIIDFFEHRYDFIQKFVSSYIESFPALK